MSSIECYFSDCTDPVYCRRVCKLHYDAARRAGKLAELPASRRDSWHTLTDVDMQAKTAVCSQCGPVKIAGTSRDNIACVLSYKSRARSGSRPSVETRRLYKLRYVYGLSVADYDALLAQQGGTCAICGKSQAKRRLAVDHDHATGSVRGLLCHTCNSGLGHFKDNVPLMESAIAYLLAHRRAAAA